MKKIRHSMNSFKLLICLNNLVETQNESMIIRKSLTLQYTSNMRRNFYKKKINGIFISVEI